MAEMRIFTRLEPWSIGVLVPRPAARLSPLLAHGRFGRQKCRSATTVTSPTDESGPEDVSRGVASSKRTAIQSAKPFSSFLTDTFNRQHDYLRISITERCNLRCVYCMPAEGVPLSPKEHLLTHPEITYLSSLFVAQGVTKIRLTGGEPTIHPQILPMIRDLGALRRYGLKDIALTTNGLTLPRKLDIMAESGVTGINLSLDTLDPFQFQIMTRRKGFDQVMKSIDRILEMRSAGVPIKLKINAVVIRGLNDAQIMPFVEMTRHKDVEVRFIEYMPFDGNRWSNEKMLTYQEMLAIIRQQHPDLTKIQDHPNDTSKTFQVPGFAGRVGFITSMTENFCGTCNRLRITSDGNLKVCLFGNSEISLRDMLRRDFNSGRPIDAEALEAIRQLETDRKHSTHAEAPAGLKEKEMKLLEVIGQAVKRKKAKHAGIGVLEHMKNRPMILIDTVQRHFINCKAQTFSPLAAVSNSPQSLRFMRAFSTKRDAVPERRLTHLTPSNNVRMVNIPPPHSLEQAGLSGASVATKPATSRLATAEAFLHFSNPDTLSLLRTASLKKGDALSVARIAGIAGSKMTSALIPLCHNIPLSGVDVDVELLDGAESEGSEHGCLKVTATARTFGQTGVEMEALVATSVASLAAYDMCKAVDKGMRVEGLRVIRKEGGRSGTWLEGQQQS